MYPYQQALAQAHIAELHRQARRAARSRDVRSPRSRRQRHESARN